jgi:hypothetical protein
MEEPMTRLSLVVMLVSPLALAACNRQPPPPPAPVLSPGEEACVAQGAQVAGVDAGTVTVTPTATTKVGDTIYTVIANGIGYNCVVTPAGVVTSFSAQ